MDALLSAVEKGKIIRAAQLLSHGSDPNKNFIGVTPLSLAIEGGDLDMVALLLDWGADASSKCHKWQTHRQLAEKMAADTSCKHRAAAERVITLLDDPEALKAHLQLVQEKVRLENERDKEQTKLLVKICCLACAVVGTAALLNSYFGPLTARMIDREL